MRRRVEFTVAILANVCMVLTYVFGPHENPFASNASRLAYAVGPGRTLIADPTRTSQIEVLVGGTKVGTPVMAAQLIIYNDGTRWIQPADYAGPDAVEVQAVPEVAIIDVACEVSKPKVNGFVVDRSRLGKGIVPLRWTLLRQNEGARITIFYRGNAALQFRLDHSLRSQTDLIRVVTDPREKVAEIKHEAPLIIGTVALALLVFIGLMYAGFNRKRGLQVAFAVPFFFLIIAVLWMVMHIAITPKMPFEF